MADLFTNVVFDAQPTGSEEEESGDASQTLLDDPDEVAVSVLSASQSPRANAYQVTLLSFFYVHFKRKASRKWTFKVRNPFIILKYTPPGGEEEVSFPYLQEAAQSAKKSRLYNVSLTSEGFQNLARNQDKVAELLEQALYAYPAILRQKYDKRCVVEGAKLKKLIPLSGKIGALMAGSDVDLGGSEAVELYNYWVAVSRTIACFLDVYALNHANFLSLFNFFNTEQDDQRKIVSTLIRMIGVVDQKQKIIAQTFEKELADERLRKRHEAKEKRDLSDLRKSREQARELERCLNKAEALLQRLIPLGLVGGRSVYGEYIEAYNKARRMLKRLSPATERYLALRRQYSKLRADHRSYFDPYNISGRSPKHAKVKLAKTIKA